MCFYQAMSPDATFFLNLNCKNDLIQYVCDMFFSIKIVIISSNLSVINKFHSLDKKPQLRFSRDSHFHPLIQIKITLMFLDLLEFEISSPTPKRSKKIIWGSLTLTRVFYIYSTRPDQSDVIIDGSHPLPFISIFQRKLISRSKSQSYKR